MKQDNLSICPDQRSPGEAAWVEVREGVRAYSSVCVGERMHGQIQVEM